MSAEWSDYVPYCVEAVREKSMGRASGGLLALVNKSIQNVKLLISCEWWIFLHLCLNGLPIIIGMIYRRPSSDCAEFLNLLSSDILDLQMRYSESRIIIGGDFNCRVGDENQLEEDIFESTNLYDMRESQDGVLNDHGKRLLMTMEDNGFILINGRAPSDRPGKFTYVGSVGRSVIDLVWCNVATVETISDLQVMECETLSDHFPVILKLSKMEALSRINRIAPNRMTKIFCNPALSFCFHQKMMFSNKLEIDFSQTTVDEQYQNLCNAVYEAAEQVGMKREFSTTRTNRISKPWFDEDCSYTKRNFGLALRACRRTGFTDENTKNYLVAKQLYRSTCKRKKAIYFKEARDLQSALQCS